MEAAGEHEPLILTPLIRAGKITEARNLSKVLGLPQNITRRSYSGFITQNEDAKFKSNTFFWYFPANVCTLHFLQLKYFKIRICILSIPMSEKSLCLDF